MPSIDTRVQWGTNAKINVLGIPNPGAVEEVTVSWSGTQLYQTSDPNDAQLHDLSTQYTNGNTYALDVGVTYDGTAGPRHFVNGNVVGNDGHTDDYELPQA